MYFDQLSNEEWALLAPILDDKPTARLNRRGRPRADPRVVANAILWILTTGEPWSSLPGRYPSGPTCRCRFEEWQSSGTLARIIRQLAQTGRTFAYVPNASSAVTRSALRRGARSQCDDGLRSVLWKSPESWQVPTRKTAGRHSIDPFDEITRQLSGRAVDATGVNAPLRIESGAMMAASLPRPLNRSCGSPWTSPPSPAMQVVERRGYVIHAAADPAPDESFRAWAEIVKNGGRIERSGLIGPRFADFETARKYALDWACQWIDQQNPMRIAAQTAPAADVARLPIARTMPEPVMEDAYDEAEHEDVSFGSSLNTAMVK
jgi:transposase